jgi:hypothetical protein
MTASPHYPFSDLTPEQLQRLLQAARHERAEVMRRFFGRLLRGWHHTLPWPPRRREAQAWPAKSQPALSLTVYR